MFGHVPGSLLYWNEIYSTFLCAWMLIVADVLDTYMITSMIGNQPHWCLTISHLGVWQSVTLVFDNQSTWWLTISHLGDWQPVTLVFDNQPSSWAQRVWLVTFHRVHWQMSVSNLWLLVPVPLKGYYSILIVLVSWEKSSLRSNLHNQRIALHDYQLLTIPINSRHLPKKLATYQHSLSNLIPQVTNSCLN